MNENTQHPLTDGALAGIWTKHAHTMGVFDYAGRRPSSDLPVVRDALRAAFDAGRAHERTTPTDPHHDPRPWQDCTREDIREGDLVEARTDDRLYVGVAHHQDEDGDWLTKEDWLLTNGTGWPLRRIPAHTTEKDTPLPETTTTTAEPLARTILGTPASHGAPHHDGVQIKAGDFLVEVDGDGLAVAGIAHHQDSDGDWRTKNGRAITWAKKRAGRPDAITVWPAPTPPAEEVEMPGEHPAHLLDVEGVDGAVCAYMALGRDGYWTGVTAEGLIRRWRPGYFAFFTLPDGTRARRDGDHPDGTPRFVKADQ